MDGAFMPRLQVAMTRKGVAMPNFDVRMSGAETVVVLVRCPSCRKVAERPLANVALGSDVSCAACGRRITVTRDNLDWIRSRADMLPAQPPPASSRSRMTALG